MGRLDRTIKGVLVFLDGGWTENKVIILCFKSVQQFKTATAGVVIGGRHDD
jgi:hypothetical protein